MLSWCLLCFFCLKSCLCWLFLIWSFLCSMFLAGWQMVDHIWPQSLQRSLSKICAFPNSVCPNYDEVAIGEWLGGMKDLVLIWSYWHLWIVDCFVCLHGEWITVLLKVGCRAVHIGDESNLVVDLFFIYKWPDNFTQLTLINLCFCVYCII